MTVSTTLTIDVSSTVFDTYVCLLDANNNYVWGDADSGTGTNARIIYKNLPVGSYYIEVSSQPGNTGGAYTLNLQPGFWPPATAITLGSTKNGTLSTNAANGQCNGRAPADRWQFSLSTNRTVTITASSSAFNTYLCLLDQANNVIGQDDNSGGGTNSKIIQTLSASPVYYIEVSSRSGTGGSYTISLN